MIRNRKRIARRFERHIAKTWGGSLDSLLAVVVACQEAGGTFTARRAREDPAAEDQLSVALGGLTGRACRVGLEVHHLLEGGLPMAGLARARTLHELAVVSMVLSEFATSTAHADLAERFLAHADVLAYKDAVEFQKNCPVLGYEPFSDEDMASMQTEADEAARRFGKNFRGPHGWAVGLPGLPPEPKFNHLEQLVNLEHLRSHYKWASHEVHADAKGFYSNMFEIDGTMYTNVGRSDDELADAASMTVIALLQTVTALLTRPESPRAEDLLSLAVIRRLVDRTQNRLEVDLGRTNKGKL